MHALKSCIIVHAMVINAAISLNVVNTTTNNNNKNNKDNDNYNINKLIN